MTRKRFTKFSSVYFVFNSQLLKPSIMQKLFRAVESEFQAIPKRVEPVSPQRQVFLMKRRKFKIICRSIGTFMFGSGMLLFYASKKEQEKYLCPWWDIKKVPPRLVTTGPYQFSRNPMYLAYLTMYSAATVFFLNWIFVSIPCFGVGILAFRFYDETYIPIEEDRLTRKFGEQYKVYQAITPRWIGFPRSVRPQEGDKEALYSV